MHELNHQALFSLIPVNDRSDMCNTSEFSNMRKWKASDTPKVGNLTMYIHEKMCVDNDDNHYSSSISVSDSDFK